VLDACVDLKNVSCFNNSLVDCFGSFSFLNAYR
jgi:hypothetical protein